MFSAQFLKALFILQPTRHSAVKPNYKSPSSHVLLKHASPLTEIFPVVLNSAAVTHFSSSWFDLYDQM